MRIVTFGASLILWFELAQAQPIYTVTDLGALGGGNSAALRVGDAGHVVGWAETANLDGEGKPLRHAFLWSQGSMTDLGTLGGDESLAHSVNSAGQVVGWAHTDTGAARAFLWLPEPAFGFAVGMNDLGTLQCPQTAALDINESAQIVGHWGGGVFLWLPTPAYGRPAGLNSLAPEPWDGHCATDCFGCWPGLSSGLGNQVGVNDRGEVVSEHRVWLPSPAYGHLSGWTDIWSFGFDYYHYGTDITNQGLVIAKFYGFYTGDVVARFIADTKEDDMYVGSWSGGASDQGEIVASYFNSSP